MPQPSAGSSLSAAPGARTIAALPGAGAVAVWQGTAASLCMMLGGLGVGWMASGSSLIRVPFFIALRDNPVLVVLCTVLVAFGGLLLVRAWLRLEQRVGDWSAVRPAVLYRIAALWCAPLMLTFPLFSRDVYAYIGQGRLMMAGLDPYVNGISALNNYHNLGPDSLWTEAPTPYGPLFLWIEQGIVWLSGGNLEVAIVLFRVVAAVGVALCAVAVVGLARHYGLDPSRTLWLTVANPLFVINFIASIHNDGLMLALLLVGLLAAVRGRPVVAVVLVTLSIGIKPITLIALPFVGLIWAGQNARWGRKVACWAATAGISGGLLAAVGALTGFWFGWLPAMTTSGTVWIWYAPFGLLAATAGAVVQLFSGPGDVVSEAVKTAGRVVGIVAAAWFVLRGTSETIMLRMALAFTAVVVTAAMIQPWYVTWLMAFFALVGVTDGWRLRPYYLVTLFFTVIALTDQLDVFEWIPIVIVRAVAIALSVAFAAYIMLWDWKTRVLFGPGAAMGRVTASR
ncbi:polyprenol phosphomannose-dependent alpha 1,6 mannosyltransferase MptB [Sinomonas sp. ASV322]|uniref:polyprenol phosphomannose-dependent alpha 1,6 mannosyltransferase MptB n=1 Tax=Sinomonas sp. ASV322 TaxID=3041920 RepID=UPI0027DBF35A|nr:polyprenol phosphomannose-dependent alpha 1,6 mannosyltransferase MptB [Sinomonas sp. ASV322]MDQ4502306.1 polyprenol phosphomannose-dependent alpha 1,6 mannosyltransferase MptB [Sinomonas sp. ASV322]